ncbi:MAG TPA: hypothetical protein VMT59_00970 [Gaiellaceae bacterium]|nr:hypothetical protein [Gaiellaceae bacterium]
MGAVLRVTFLADGAVDRTLDYQRYYLLGLERTCRLRFADLPAILRFIPGADAKVRVARRLDGSRLVGNARDSGHVRRYLADDDGLTRRFAIDARDNRAVLDQEVLDWSEVYFKANRWPTEQYDPKVVPIVNGNGVLDWSRIAHLRNLRDRPKDIDVVFISRIWGGREHNVRLFEELARLGARSDLHAILPHGADPEDDRAITARLERVGVKCNYETVPPDELWDRLSRARIVVFRSGMHLCIPWRMVDLLAMGACILFDARPLPQWPEPLEAGVHYAEMGIERPPFSPPEPTEYAKVGPAVEALLADGARAAELRRNAAVYFDAHAAPERVGEYILETLRTHKTFTDLG